MIIIFQKIGFLCNLMHCALFILKLFSEKVFINFTRHTKEYMAQKIKNLCCRDTLVHAYLKKYAHF